MRRLTLTIIQVSLADKIVIPYYEKLDNRQKYRYIEFRPEGAARLLFEQQAASFEHNLRYAKPIDFKFID